MKTSTRAYTAVMIAALVAVIAVPSQAGLFNIDESSEIRMGRDASHQIESRYPVNHDPKLNRMVNEIGFRLIRVSERPNLPWQFKVLDVKDVNAVSVPGYVYVNKGLIDFVGGDEDQLAAVIAHEIGHSAGRHAIRQAEKEIQYSLALSFLLKGSVAQLGNIAANLALLGYSRKDEYDADKRGLQYLDKAGYDMNSMVKFFQHLEQKEPDKSSHFETYFRTHPPTPNRIARAESEIAAIQQAKQTEQTEQTSAQPLPSHRP